MSNIDAQIKALLLKKKKIDYVSYVADLIKNDTKCHDFKEVKEEVVAKIEPFLLSLMENIENPKEVSEPEVMSFLSEEEKNAIKLVAKAALNRTQIPQSPQPPRQDAPKKDAGSTQDKMNFAMNNRHLAAKKVQVLNDQNAQIFGTVVGLDAPFVLVKTETGPTIQVPVEKVVPL